MDKPTTMKEAINNVRLYQHLHQSVCGRFKKMASKDVLMKFKWEQAICGAQANAPPLRRTLWKKPLRNSKRVLTA
jgi:hypothetical protein